MTQDAKPYGPLSVLAVCLLPIFGAPAIHSTRHGLVVVVPLLLVAALVIRSWGAALRRFAIGALAVVSIGISTWLYGGRDLDVAVGASLRVLYLILPAVALTSFIDPARLGDHLAQRLRLPARAVVAGTVALERLESLGQQWQQIARARRARGVGPDRGPVQRIRTAVSMAVALLVSSMRMSGAMSLAMDARGFAAADRRTWAEPAPWQPRDTAILLAGLVVAALPWLAILAPAEIAGVR